MALEAIVLPLHQSPGGGRVYAFRTQLLSDRAGNIRSMWPQETRAQVHHLLRTGRSAREASRIALVPLSTVKRWHGEGSGKRQRVNTPKVWRPPEPIAYCYILGAYLGDGHVVWGKNSGTVGFALDAAYPRVIARVESALGQTFPNSRVRSYRHAVQRKTGVFLSSSLLALAFPQHGPGKKHERTIELMPWQRDLTVKYPEHLIRGLIHSDGCRTVNRFSTKLPSGRVATYEYPRYFFSNLSADIRRIFCEHCDLLGIRWTQSNARNISISHRHSVALLDSFIGPKQ